MFRDVTGLGSGVGFALLVLAGFAAYFVSVKRFTGASFCAAAVMLLLAQQYVSLAHISAVSSLIWSTNWGTQSPIDPSGLGAHVDVGFYTIALGALAIVAARLYPGRNAPVQNIRGSADAGAKRNGNGAITKREFDRTDSAE